MHRQTPTLGDEQPEPWIGHSVLELHKWDEPRPWLVEDSGDWQESWGSLDICAEHVHTCSPWRQYGQRSALETAGVSCDILDMCSHPNQVNTLGLLTQTTARQWICQGHHPREGLTLRLETIQSRGRASVGVAVSCWHLLKQHIWSSPNLWEPLSHSSHQVYSGNTHKHSLSCSVVSKQGGCGRAWGQSIICEGQGGLALKACPERNEETTAEAWTCNISDTVCTAIDDMSWVSARAPFTSALPCSGAKFLVWRGRKKKKKSIPASLGQPSGLFTPATWDKIPPSVEQRDGHLAERKLRSHLAPALALHLQPHGYQGDSCQHTLKKDVTCIYINFSSYRRLGTWVCIRTLSKTIPFQEHNR